MNQETTTPPNEIKHDTFPISKRYEEFTLTETTAIKAMFDYFSQDNKKVLDFSVTTLPNSKTKIHGFVIHNFHFSLRAEEIGGDHTAMWRELRVEVIVDHTKVGPTSTMLSVNTVIPPFEKPE